MTPVTTLIDPDDDDNDDGDNDDNNSGGDTDFDVYDLSGWFSDGDSGWVSFG